MIKNVLPSLRQKAGPQRICSRQKSIRSGTARDSFSQTPHMRGKAKGDEFGLGQTRITPACAGKRRTPKQCVFNSRDHPRVCGEKSKTCVTAWDWRGSPPHVRGKGLLKVFVPEPLGITPACAGKSTYYQDSVYTTPGSPPRMRGKVCALLSISPADRITPACAGKSLRPVPARRKPRDHPRMCGEKETGKGGQIPRLGSPPHVRGKACGGGQAWHPARITPTCAGKR